MGVIQPHNVGLFVNPLIMFLLLCLCPQQQLFVKCKSLQWRHNERDGVSNHRRHDRLLNRLFRRKSKKTSKLRVNGLCVGNSPETGEFPAQKASNAESVTIWWLDYVEKKKHNAKNT